MTDEASEEPSAPGAPGASDELAESDESAESEEWKPLDGSEGSGGAGVGWPVEWSGIVETVVATRGLGGSWNVAALGLFAPERADDAADDTAERKLTLSSTDDADADQEVDDRVRARTWGRTETRRNFASRGGGVVSFTRDPVDFVEAACSVREDDEPVLDSADAWVRVEAERLGTERIGSAVEGEVERVEWALEPVEVHVEREVVPVTSRAHAAVVEATVAASRLDVPEYDTAVLRDRIQYFGEVVESCGGPRDREAWERFETLVDWR